MGKRPPGGVLDWSSVSLRSSSSFACAIFATQIIPMKKIVHGLQQVHEEEGISANARGLLWTIAGASHDEGVVRHATGIFGMHFGDKIVLL